MIIIIVIVAIAFLQDKPLFCLFVGECYVTYHLNI